LGAEHGGELWPQDLDRHLAVVLEVRREVDGGHAARAELALDAIAAGECGGEAAVRVAQRITVVTLRARMQGARECTSGDLSVAAPAVRTGRRYDRRVRRASRDRALRRGAPRGGRTPPVPRHRTPRPRGAV